MFNEETGIDIDDDLLTDSEENDPVPPGSPLNNQIWQGGPHPS
jgi:hypothetical protein